MTTTTSTAARTSVDADDYSLSALLSSDQAVPLIDGELYFATCTRRPPQRQQRPVPHDACASCDGEHVRIVYDSVQHDGVYVALTAAGDTNSDGAPATAAGVPLTCTSRCACRVCCSAGVCDVSTVRRFVHEVACLHEQRQQQQVVGSLSAARPLVVVSSGAARERTQLACLLGCYCLVARGWSVAQTRARLLDVLRPAVLDDYYSCCPCCCPCCRRGNGAAAATATHLCRVAVVCVLDVWRAVEHAMRRGWRNLRVEHEHEHHPTGLVAVVSGRLYVAATHRTRYCAVNRRTSSSNNNCSSSNSSRPLRGARSRVVAAAYAARLHDAGVTCVVHMQPHGKSRSRRSKTRTATTSTSSAFVQACRERGLRVVSFVYSTGEYTTGAMHDSLVQRFVHTLASVATGDDDDDTDTLPRYATAAAPVVAVVCLDEDVRVYTCDHGSGCADDDAVSTTSQLHIVGTLLCAYLVCRHALDATAALAWWAMCAHALTAQQQQHGGGGGAVCAAMWPQLQRVQRYAALQPPSSSWQRARHVPSQPPQHHRNEDVGGASCRGVFARTRAAAAADVASVQAVLADPRLLWGAPV